MLRALGSKSRVGSSLTDEGASIVNLAKLELQRRGLLLSQDTYLKLRRRADLAGNAIATEKFLPLLGEDLAREMNGVARTVDSYRFQLGIPVAVTFGYEFGLELARALGGKQEACKRAAWCCALAHLTAALLDIFLDDMPRSFPNAYALAWTAIDRAFSESLATDELEPDLENPLLLIFWRVVSEMGREIRCVRPALPRALTVELMNTVHSMLAAERPRCFDSVPEHQRLAAIYEHLRIRNSYPFWTETLLCLMYLDESPSCSEILDLKETMLALGDVFWITDDIADLAPDLECEHWNYLLLELATVKQLPDMKFPALSAHRELYCDLLQYRIIEGSIDNLFNRVGLLSKIYGTPSPDTPLAQLMKVYIKANLR